MDEIMKNILLISVVGGVLALVLLCIKPLTKKLFSPRWQYYIWLTVLIVMVLPIKVSLLSQPVHITTTENTAVQTEQIAPAEIQQEQATPAVLEELSQSPALKTPDIPINIVRISGFLWIAVAVLLLGYKLVKYTVFLHAIKKYSVIECSLENIPKRLTVRKTELLDAPLIVGLIKPVLYLPKTEIKEEKLDYILLHELTHYSRHDLLYKWFVMLVSSIHWFNPFVYIVSKQIDEECEVSCDYEVCKNLSEPQKKDYMTMILDFVQTSIRKKRPLTTQMASSKKMLERRFIMIRTKKATSKLISVISVVLAIAMLSTTVFASGVLSGLTEDNYTVEITNNGEVIKLVNKPFIENDEVYVPLREIFEKVGVMEHEGSSIEWNDGEIFVILTPGAGNEEMVSFGFNIQINERSFEYEIYSGKTLSRNETAYYPPILKDSVTYIPYELIDLMLNQRYNNNWNIDYVVFDIAHNDKTIDIIENLPRKLCTYESQLLSPNYENEQSLCYEVTCAFFDSLQTGDIQSMKPYCTPTFIENELADGTLLEYPSGTMWSVYSIYLYADGKYRVTVSFYPNNDVTNDNDEVVLTATVAIQEDGRALIEGIESEI